MDDNARKYVTKYVEDLHSLITHGQQPLDDQLGNADGHPDGAHLVRLIKATLDKHEALLAQRLQALGTSPTTGVQDAAAGVAGKVAGLYNHMRSEAMAKSLRDDYTFVSHCSVSWLMLLTTARALGDHETEELAEEGYRDAARLVMELDRSLPDVLVTELRQDGFQAQDVSEWAGRIVHDAWTRTANPTAA